MATQLDDVKASIEKIEDQLGGEGGLWRWIGWHSGLPFGQVILEDADPSDPDDEGAWIHVSLGAPWRSASRCGQRWTWTPAEGYVRIYTEPRA